MSQEKIFFHIIMLKPRLLVLIQSDQGNTYLLVELLDTAEYIQQNEMVLMRLYVLILHYSQCFHCQAKFLM